MADSAEDYNEIEMNPLRLKYTDLMRISEANFGD